MYFYFNNLKIYYEKTNLNNGNLPILFLHGWGGSVSSFKFFEKHLRMHANCIFIDFPPFGKSSMLQTPYNIEDYADLVVNFLKHIKVKRVNIVAHSFGGRVALFLASRYKNFVNKMLLTGCAGIKRKEFKIKFKLFVFKIKKFLTKIKLYSPNKLNNQGSEDYKKLNSIMKQTFNQIINFDETFLLKDITCETLFIWGKLDKETPFYFTKIFKKNIKNSEVIVFENANHFAYLQQPQKFLLILNSFFKI